MANHKSAEKRYRQSERRRVVNKSNLTRLRTQLKKIRTAVEAKNQAEVKALLSPTLSLIDRSIQKGTLHRNTAARYKSRLMQQAHALLSAPAAS
ncbi:MAG: 30S ribosomal protein S20 [Terriglobia bacterium]